MENRNWRETFAVEVGGGSQRYCCVRSVRDAAHHLVDAWPGLRNAAYRDALIACTKALRGEAGDEAALKAFVKATTASRIKIRSISDISTQLFEQDLAKALRDSLREDEHEDGARPMAASPGTRASQFSPEQKQSCVGM